MATSQVPPAVQKDEVLPFELSTGKTVTYEETVSFLAKLSGRHKRLSLHTAGKTDIGKPLHVAILSDRPYKNGNEARDAGKIILWINNGIHPGEPEGIDATLALIRNYLGGSTPEQLLEKLVIVIVPVYNVDGMLNRNSHSRVNQDGPEAYGFRGNARNLDLNRDFIKCDSRNARSFTQLYHQWLPDVFLDNHTSNGADYQHTMTLLATQHQRLGGPKGAYLKQSLLPALYKAMEDSGLPMCPYVMSDGTPDKGILGFNDSPRYSSGYAALFGAISLLTETHMLKPFLQRLESNYVFMDLLVRQLITDAETIAALRYRHEAYDRSMSEYPLQWRPDKDRADTILFRGYAAAYRPSEVSGQPRLYYDRDKPWVATIPYYDYYTPSLYADRPLYFLIPQAWEEVIQRLEWNGVRMARLIRDTVLSSDYMRIASYQTMRRPYEGHYPHYDVSVTPEHTERQWRQGDVAVPLDQPAFRYLMETLDPRGEDSFFAWNFFDAMLSRKEGYSDYVFEDLASEFLQARPDIQEALQAKKDADPDFAANPGAQLFFIYERSPWSEPGYLLYPVARHRQPIDETILTWQ